MNVPADCEPLSGNETGGLVTVLHLEDSHLDAELARVRLSKAPFPVAIERVLTAEQFTRCLTEHRYQLILSDYNLPDFDGLSALEIAQDLCPQIPFIFLTGALGEEVAIDMLKRGATDYVLKQRMERLLPAATRALSEARERTRRRHAEAALRVAEAQYWAAVNNVQEYAILAIGPDGRVKTWNRGAALMWGYSAEGAIGLEFSALFTPEDVADGRPARELQAAGSQGESRGQRTCIRKDGTRLDTRFVLTATYGPDREIAGWLEVTHDVTAQNLAQEEREALLARETAARSEAESANRVKDEFLAVASHELRTPLNAILGWSSLLQVSPQPDDLKEGLSTIHRNAKHQAKLIEDILDVSRMITGRLRLNPKPHDLAPVIAGSLETLRTAADAKGVKLRHRLRDIGPISCDADRIEQVVWNLVSNAIKFSERGSEVVVKLSRTQAAAVITVADSGAGIAPHFLPRVFERFQQADASTTRRYGGLGLGLAIVRHLVELHGGTVTAESDGEGQGSTFTVELPAPLPHHATSSLPIPRHGPVDAAVDCPPEIAGLRVLIVDDDADARRLMQNLLERCGAEVRVAGSVHEALTHVSDAYLPDLALSDIGMPEADGYAFIQLLRDREAHLGIQRIPTAAITAYTRATDRHSVAAAGFDLFLPKPVEPNDLLRTVLNLSKRQ